MDDFKENIAERLREFVEENFASTAELARQMELKSRQELVPYIKGTSLPGAEKLKKLCELGCDINWLLTGKPSNNYNGSPHLQNNKIKVGTAQSTYFGSVHKQGSSNSEQALKLLLEEKEKLIETQNQFIKVLLSERNKE